MAMYLKDNLIIKVSDSDTTIDRRLKDTVSNAQSNTTNYYINDNNLKKDEIIKWFNNFNYSNEFYIDLLKMETYLYNIKEKIIPNRDEFIDDLIDIESDVSYFINLTKFSKENLFPINKMELAGESGRYLKFDNSSEIIIAFKKLIFGRVTNIIIEKNKNKYIVFLEMDTSHLNKISNYNPKPPMSYNIRENINANIKGGYNKIYYGTPGSGKSYLVKSKYEKLESIVFRTTFHPDYSNSDFIGQLVPTLNNDNILSYQFNPGVFSLALKSSLEHKDKKIVLIIEELNRGNASAIFGDIFQLLDRDSNGESMYKINIPIMSNWLNSQELKIDDIFIPSNLYIIATMNTSDQNVYTLDTAFKRRWEMESVMNNFDQNLYWFDYYVPGSNVSWRDFVSKVNNFIISNNYLNIHNEDKQIGVYFINEKSLSMDSFSNDVDAARSFAYKILMYIWEDVAKINKDEWFLPEIKTLDNLISKFIENTINKENSLSVFNIFVD